MLLITLNGLKIALNLTKVLISVIEDTKVINSTAKKHIPLYILFSTFALAGRSIAALLIMMGRGKSGQHRASHFLTGRSRLFTGTASATEKYSQDLMSGDGENVR